MSVSKLDVNSLVAYPNQVEGEWFRISYSDYLSNKVSIDANYDVTGAEEYPVLIARPKTAVERALSDFKNKLVTSGEFSLGTDKDKYVIIKESELNELKQSISKVKELKQILNNL